MRDNMDEIPSGGIGIKLIGKIADELSYTRTSNGRNCLLIVKYYQQPGLVKPEQSTEAGVFQQLYCWLQKQRTRQSDRSSSQPLHKINIELNSDLKAVSQILSWIEQLEKLPIPEAVLQQCKLAAVEGFTNAVRHAHKHLPLETPIELEIIVFNNERLEVRIWDWGEPFDLQAKLEEELPEKSPFSWSDLGFTIH